MPIAILQKAVDELSKDKPKLDYIRGLLETLIEIQPKPTPANPIYAQLNPAQPNPIHIGASGKPSIKIGKLPAESKENASL